MINSISSNTLITNSSYENQTNEQSNSVSISTDDTKNVLLGDDTFEKSEEPTEAEKEQVALEKIYNNAKNKTTNLAENQISTKSKAVEDYTIKVLESFLHRKLNTTFGTTIDSSNVTTLDPINLTAEEQIRKIFGGDDMNTVNNAADQQCQYERTPEGQKFEHEYEEALKEQKSAKFQEKSEEELSKLSNNSYEKEIALYEHMSGVSELTKQFFMKTDIYSYKSTASLHQMATKKNDDLLSNNAKNYLNKLRTDNADTAICINDSNDYSMNSDYIGYYACFDKNLFELMANNKDHDDVWTKMINNQYDTFDDVISDINKSGDSSLASKLQDYNSKISKKYHV